MSGDIQDTFGEPLRGLIFDTIGEQNQFQALSDIAYVGGSMLYRGSNKVAMTSWNRPFRVSL